MRRLISRVLKGQGLRQGDGAVRRLLVASYLWAAVLALGVWDYYIIKFPPCHLPRIYQEVLMPVVMVRANGATGSGVIIGSRVNELVSSTYVLSAAHVVGNESTATIYIYDYESPVVTVQLATVVSTDTYKDLALLRINRTQINAGHRDIIYPAKLAPRNYTPYLFTEVYAVGCSLGLNPRPSSGIITATGSRYEISAPILPGNSGGGVFLKSTHELIGIVVWVRTYHGQLVNTMCGIVPINEIYEFLSNTSVGFQYSEMSGHRARVTGAIWLNDVTCSKKGQAKRSPYLRKAARKTSKCSSLGIQHSKGGELTWQQ